MPRTRAYGQASNRWSQMRRTTCWMFLAPRRFWRNLLQKRDNIKPVVKTPSCKYRLYKVCDAGLSRRRSRVRASSAPPSNLRKTNKPPEKSGGLFFLTSSSPTPAEAKSPSGLRGVMSVNGGSQRSGASMTPRLVRWSTTKSGIRSGLRSASFRQGTRTALSLRLPS